MDVLTHSLPERKRFYRGLADWIGFEQRTLLFDVAPREQGVSGFSIRSLISLTATAMMSFSSAPLRIVSILGLLTFLLGIGVGTEAVVVLGARRGGFRLRHPHHHADADRQLHHDQPGA